MSFRLSDRRIEEIYAALQGAKLQTVNEIAAIVKFDRRTVHAGLNILAGEGRAIAKRIIAWSNVRNTAMNGWRRPLTGMEILDEMSPDLEDKKSEEKATEALLVLLRTYHSKRETNDYSTPQTEFPVILHRPEPTRSYGSGWQL